MAKGGLGKGLGSLMGDAAAEFGSNTDYSEIPIDSVKPNPYQPRTDFSEEKIKELAASIKKDGLLQPIIVRDNEGEYEIVAGERRWQACKEIGFTTIPARVLALDDVEAQKISLVENLQRDDLNPIEEARGYQRLVELGGMRQKDVAEAVSKNQATISNALRLLALPEEVQDMMYEGKLSQGHGRAILAVADDEARVKLAKKVVDEKLSVRETENMARLYSTTGEVAAKRAVTPRSFKTVARKLRQRLETGVKVKATRGKNKIEIEFQDEDDLLRIFNIINGGLEQGGSDD